LRGGDLEVEARFAPGVVGVPRVDDEAGPYVRDVTSSTEYGWRVVRYRFALREAAQRFVNVETAIASGDVIVAPPSTWLLRPDVPTPGDFRFHVATIAPARFLAGTHPARDGAADTYEAPTAALEGSGFAVFGGFHTQTVSSGPARVVVAVAPDRLSLGDADVASWVKSAVDAIALYLRRDFPVARTLVVVQAGKARSPTRGETLGDGGPSVLIRAAPGLTAAATRDDWVMAHELLHVVLPSFAREHMWLSEGIPSYVEPLARVRAGTITPEKVWLDLVEGLPQGLPQPGDEGLENTHTWGRTYWGGSLFCLIADVRLRERTNNVRSLDDVIRAVVATGDDVEAHWDVSRLLDVGDEATGTRVLHEVFEELARAPGTVDLAALWKRLGISLGGTGVTFDDTAPLAAVRRAITGSASSSESGPKHLTGSASSSESGPKHLTGSASSSESGPKHPTGSASSSEPR
jgi:hypothetical protein